MIKTDIIKHLDKRIANLIYILDNTNFPENSTSKIIITAKLDAYSNIKDWLKNV